MTYPSKNNWLVGCTVVVTMIGAAVARAQTIYPDPPQVLRDEVAAVAEQVVVKANQGVAIPAAEVSKVYSMAVFYTVADALGAYHATPAAPPARIRELKARRFTAETSRTDKQLGSAPSASGSTSLLEKPGLQGLVSFAVDHGAILRESTGTSATVMTNPYALATLGIEDTAARFDRYDLLRRFELSGSFKLDASNNAEIDFDQLEQWSVRLRLWGDRSTRSAAFAEDWKRTVEPLIAKLQLAENEAMSNIVNEMEWVRSASATARRTLLQVLARYLEQNRSTADDERRAMVAQFILANLYEHIHRPLSADPGILVADEDVRRDPQRLRGELARLHATINGVLVPNLRKGQDAFAEAEKENNKLMESYANSELISLAYTNHRVDRGSGFSDLKLLAELPLLRGESLAPDLIVNAGVSFYHSPDSAQQQDAVRSYNGAIALQWATHNIFADWLQIRLDESKLAFAISGRCERLQDTADTVWLGQARVEIPVAPGVTMPISVTYASQRDLVKEEEVRGNFGFSLDTDKLFALATASRMLR